MIYLDPIACPNVERLGYIIYENMETKVSKCIGKLVEQENDAGEVQYLVIIDWENVTEEDVDDVIIAGIDLAQRKKVYVRSYTIPYFIECRVMPHFRGDYPMKLKARGMTYSDDFEYILRGYGITQHSNCYIGRTPVDFINRLDGFWNKEYAASIIPNLKENPENVFHDIDQDEYKELIPLMEKPFSKDDKELYNSNYLTYRYKKVWGV